MFLKRVFLLLTAALLALLCIACSAASPEGAWVAADGTAPFGYPDEIEFLDDGLCVIDGMSGIFQCKDGKLMISAFGMAQVFAYEKKGSTMTLDDGSGAVSYVTAENSGKKAAMDSFTEPLTNMSPTPTEEELPVEEELPNEAFLQDIAALTEKLDAFDGAGDTEGALQYLTEQLPLLQTTYPDEDLSAFEQRHTAYADAYRQQALSGAKDAFASDGYEAALGVLHHAALLLGSEDAAITEAIELYDTYGPVRFDDMFDNYFYRERKDGIWTLGTNVQDNLGEEYASAVYLFAYLPSPHPSRYVYALTGKHSTFSGRVFLDYETRSTNSEEHIRIYGDDTLLWESPTMTAGVMPIDFSVDITGYSQLTIESEVTKFHEYDHVQVYLANGMFQP